MLLPSCLTASSSPQSGSIACSISATPHSPQNPPERLCLRSPPPQQTRWEPGLGAALELEALEPKCTYPSTQNGRIHPIPERGTQTLIPKSKVQNRNHAKSRQIRTNPTFPSFPGHGLLSHLTNSRPTLPLSERTHVKRFSRSTRGQSGHLVIGTSP